MPQFVNMVLKDHAAADHTFSPSSISGGIATAVESDGVPIGDKRISVSTNQTSNGRRKVTVKMTIPVIQDAVVAGVSRPTLVRAAYADVTLSFDGASSSAERLDVAAYISNLFKDAMFVNVVDTLQGPY